MQLKYHVHKIGYAYVSLLLSATVELAVSLSWCQNGKNCDTSEEELRDWSETEAKAQHINAATTLWSPCREWWVQERGAAASKAKKAVLRNCHILAFGEVKNRTHILKLNVRFGILLTSYTSWTNVPKAHGMPTYSSNANMLFQRSLRCAWGLHCNTYQFLCRYLIFATKYSTVQVIISTGETWR